MTRLVCIHEVNLAEGADAVEFERVFTEFITQPGFVGWKTRLLRGDRGERAGQYAILHEVDSPEARDRYFPADGEQSKEFDRLVADHPESVEIGHKMNAFLTGSEVVTDYLVVVE